MQSILHSMGRFAFVPFVLFEEGNMIIYKVVLKKKYSRISYSCCATDKYQLEYIKGKITEAVPATAVMCFETKKQAQNFIIQLSRYIHAPHPYGWLYRILKVESIGNRIFFPFYTSLYNSLALDIYYEMINKTLKEEYLKTHHFTKGFNLQVSHSGTICFSAIKVLRN